MTHIIHIKL